MRHIIEATHKTATFIPLMDFFFKKLKTKEDRVFLLFGPRTCVVAWYDGVFGYLVGGYVG